MTARLGAAARCPAVLALVLLTACRPGSSEPPPAVSAVKASPTVPAPPPRLQAPAAAILDDATAGLPRLAAADRLTAAQAARDQPDEPAALALYSGWGWIEASTRSWGSGGRRLDATVLLSVRATDARHAHEYWSADADRPPLSVQPCPAGIVLDDCRYAAGGGRSLVVGRLDAAVFRLSGTGLDVGPLAQPQAARLRA